jgi:isopentenyl-diphosphate Delta-isomerase
MTNAVINEAARLVAKSEIMIPALDAAGALYPIEKLDAHTRAVPHLAVSVFVFDGDAMLLQRRALSKYHCGGQWANTCCTHPHWGEALDVSAIRRVREELGITVPLHEGRQVEYRAPVGNGLTEHEHVTFYVGQADRNTLALAPDPAEVMETRWATWAELAPEMTLHPERFAPWFRIYMQRFPGFAV